MTFTIGRFGVVGLDELAREDVEGVLEEVEGKARMIGGDSTARSGFGVVMLRTDLRDFAGGENAVVLDDMLGVRREDLRIGRGAEDEADGDLILR